MTTPTMPDDITTVTLTGRYIKPNGARHSGKVTFTTPALVQLADADTVAVGATTVTLDANGEFTVNLVATDNAAMQPTGWVYTVTEQLDGVQQRMYSMALPSAESPVDIADKAPASPTQGNYVPVAGPAGPAGQPGNTILSGSGTPSSGVGRDGDFWMDTTGWQLFGPKASGVWPSTGLPITDVITSVNGHTGVVDLTAADVHAPPLDSGGANVAITGPWTFSTSVPTVPADPTTGNQVTRKSYVDSQAGARLAKASNLTDLADSAAARTALGLGTSATRAVGTSSGTVAAGDDSRITSALVASPAVFRQRDLPPLITQRALYTSTAIGGTCNLSLAQTSTQTTGFVKYAPSPVPLSGTGNTAETYGPFVYGQDEIVQSAQSTNFVVSTSIDPHTTANTAGYLNIAFGTEADVFQVRLLPQTTSDTIRIFIDGVPVQDKPILLSSIATLGTPGNSHLLTVNLGTAGPRRIRLEVLNARFGGVYQSPAYDFWKISLHGPKIAVLGDSTTGGSNVNTGGGSGTWFNYMCDLFGWENHWNQSRGGTGFITPNGAYSPFPNRVALDIVGKNFDIVIVDGGWNDATTSQTTFQDAVTSTISAIKTGLPKAYVLGVGCYTTSGNWPPYAATPTATPVAGSVTKDGWQRTVFQAQGIPYISQITGEIRDAAWNVVDTIGPWMTGSGRVGTTTGFGSADRFLGDGASDAIHPTDAGHKAKGQWMATALRKLLAV